MSEINQVTPSSDSQEQMLEQLRSRALEAFELAPIVAAQGRTPKEMRVRNSTWVVRGLIVFLTILVLVEGAVIFRVQSTPAPANFETNVPVTLRQAPQAAVVPSPPVEGAQPVVIGNDPAEFSAPLPDELHADIDSGEVAPLPAEFPPPDFSEEEAENDA